MEGAGRSPSLGSVPHSRDRESPHFISVVLDGAVVAGRGIKQSLESLRTDLPRGCVALQGKIEQAWSAKPSLNDLTADQLGEGKGVISPIP